MLFRSIMRTKEEASDYRYFPEPDLGDFAIDQAMIDKAGNFIGELPIDKRNRFLKMYSLTTKEVDILIFDIFLANFFEASVKLLAQPKSIANWLLGPFLEFANSEDKGLAAIKITPQNFVKVVKYFQEGKINNLAAKKILSLAFKDNKDVDIIIKEERLIQVSDKDELGKFVEEVIVTNPKAMADLKAGHKSVIMFLVGEVMKKTRGKANPKVVSGLLRKKLEQ